MLRISIGPSRHLMVLLCLAHAAAAAACLAADAPIGLKIIVVVLIGASGALSLYGPALLRSPTAIIALEIIEGGALSFQTRNGEWHKGTLLASSFVAPYLTVLNVKSPGKALTRHIVIMADSIASDEFRRLRVLLRWRRADAA